MKLSSKLELGFGSVLGLLMVTIVLTTLSLTHITGRIDEIRRQISLMVDIKDREMAHLDWAASVQAGLADPASRRLDAEADPHKCAFGKWYYSPESASAVAENPALGEPMKDIERHHAVLHHTAAKISEALESNDRALALLIYSGETLPALKKVREGFATVAAALGEDLNRSQSEAAASAARTTRLMVSAGIAAFILCLVIALVIVTGVRRQLGGDPGEVAKAARAISEGDLTVEIPGSGKFADSALACLGRMSASLGQMISEISAAAHSLVLSVEQISRGNQDLSRRSAERAASLEEIAAALEEASSGIRETSGGAAKAQEVSAEACRTAEAGGQVIIEAVDAINELNRSGKKISRISTVINEIAFQTDLLALNAAVEADRAGEHGKGFAVVAGEVGNLARRSGEAAREIASLIDESVAGVESATNLANKGRAALEEIVTAAKNTGGLIAGVASASEEQLRGVDRISLAISGMNSLTRQDAALVKETATTGEAVASQARGLLALIKSFKTRVE